jgi:hypothetical protein
MLRVPVSAPGVPNWPLHQEWDYVMPPPMFRLRIDPSSTRSTPTALSLCKIAFLSLLSFLYLQYVAYLHLLVVTGYGTQPLLGGSEDSIVYCPSSLQPFYSTLQRVWAC